MTTARYRAEAKDFSSNLYVGTVSRAHASTCTMGTGGKARPGRDADNSPHLQPRSTQCMSYTSSPAKRHHDVQRNRITAVELQRKTGVNYTYAISEDKKEALMTRAAPCWSTMTTIWAFLASCCHSWDLLNRYRRSVNTFPWAGFHFTLVLLLLK
jgi:hypothetical protein